MLGGGLLLHASSFFASLSPFLPRPACRSMASRCPIRPSLTWFLWFCITLRNSSQYNQMTHTIVCARQDIEKGASNQTLRGRVEGSQEDLHDCVLRDHFTVARQPTIPQCTGVH